MFLRKKRKRSKDKSGMSLMVDSLNFLSITKAGMGWDRKRARENSQDAIPSIQSMVSAWIGIAGVEIEK